MTNEYYEGVKPEYKGKRSDWHVSHTKEGFVLRIGVVSTFRSAVDMVADKLCAFTRHRFCHHYSKVANWAYREERVIHSVPIDRETADKLSWHAGTWDFLDEDDE